LSFIDARKCFVTSIVGTEIPYIKNLKSLISEIINYPHEGILVDKKILINCFKFTELFKEKYKNYYYCIHTDDPIDYHSFGQIAIVLFLNKHYEIGEGINFYEHLFEPTESTFVSKDKVKVSHFVQAKCNTAVLFDSKIFHSQFTPTDQFTKEFRYTQVIFVPLFEV
jgi:hypothetical protein